MVPYGDLDFSPPAMRAQWKEANSRRQGTRWLRSQKDVPHIPHPSLSIVRDYFVLFLTVNIWVCA